MFIIGTSGVGKSVTIKHLIGLLRIDAGEIWFDGTARRRAPRAQARAAAQAHRHGVPELDAVRLDDARRERRPAAAQAPAACATHAALDEAQQAARAGLHGRVRRPLSRRALRRHAQARRDRAHARARSRGRAVRRADDRPRSGERAPHRPADPRARRQRSASPRSSSRTIRHRSSASPIASLPLPGRRPRRRDARRAARLARSGRPAVHQAAKSTGPMETPGF